MTQVGLTGGGAKFGYDAEFECGETQAGCGFCGGSFFLKGTGKGAQKAHYQLDCYNAAS